MSVRQQYISLLVLVIVALFLGGLAWQEASHAWPTNEEKTLLKTFLFYESWLMFLFLPLVIWGFKHKKVSMGFFLIGVIGVVFGVYARFVEPNLLFVKYTSIKTGYTLKLALISDMHYGLYSTPQQMQRLVDKLNTLDVDAVVVAGDWTYEPLQKISLTEKLKPFSQLKYPVYSVPGNHDEEMPGPPLAKELKVALLANNIKPIEGQSVDLGKVRLVGVGDLLMLETRNERLAALRMQDKPLLLLTHNPDSFYELPKLTQPFVMLAGHTHGGQINLPILTEKILALMTRDGYKRGLYSLPDRNQLFVTSGIGMVGLPLRFAMPPVIDVLEMY
jgi:predicted MPP superfamily phosphohydrolase